MTSIPSNADELVSAYIDGQAAPDEIALVEASEELMARVDAQQAITEALNTPLTPPIGQKEAHLGAALDAFDAMFANGESTGAPAAEQPTTEPTQAVVSSLDAARERRQRRFSPATMAAAIAAVVLLVVVAALNFGGSSSDDLATSSFDDADVVSAASESSDAADSAMDTTSEARVEPEIEAALDDSAGAQAAAPAAEADAMAEEAMADDAMDEEAMDQEEAEAIEAEPSAGDTTQGDADQGDTTQGDTTSESLSLDNFAMTFSLGSYATVDELVAELETLTPEQRGETTERLAPGLFPGCQPEVAALAEIETATLLSQVMIAELLHEVHVISTASGIDTFYVINAADCSIAATTP